MSAISGAAVIHPLSVRPPPSLRKRSPSKTETPLPANDENPRYHLLRSGQKPTPSNLPRRRDVLLLLPLPAVVFSLAAGSPSAAGFSLGISGPKEWLRDQKKKSAKFVLAPIDASRQSLHNAYILLSSDAGSPADDSGEIRRLLSSAARDCVPQQRNSFVEFQSQTGVEVCTFRLIVNNAASLLDNNDPLKLEAEAMLGDLIRSFASLGSIIGDSNFHLSTDRQKVKYGLMDTISALDKFEQGIKDCLGI